MRKRKRFVGWPEVARRQVICASCKHFDRIHPCVILDCERKYKGRIRRGHCPLQKW